MRNVHIRRYSPSADAEIFQELYQKIFPEKKITLESVHNIASELATIWLLERVGITDKSVLIGFLYFWTILDEMQVIDVGIVSEERRRGFGKLLLQRLLDLARGDNRDITLEVRAANAAAIALYESLGFVQSGLRKAYYSDGEDAVLYSYLSL